MQRVLLLVTAAVLVGAVAVAQLQITSFNSTGELSWTNSISRGFYNIESASSPAGPWNPLATVADLDWAKTNSITLQASVTNAQAFYRVQWLVPDPIGVWDYRGYYRDGTVVITGQLTVSSMTVLSTNDPANTVHGVRGWWSLQYAGPPTNQVWHLGPQIGTGSFGGHLDVGYAHLNISWPTNVVDDNIQLIGTLSPNTYTGTWNYYTLEGPRAGPFGAQRR
jgi:hypothetical protein